MNIYILTMSDENKMEKCYVMSEVREKTDEISKEWRATLLTTAVQCSEQHCSHL